MKKLIDCLQVGSRVFDILEGWGIVTDLCDDTIFAKFDRVNDDTNQMVVDLNLTLILQYSYTK